MQAKKYHAFISRILNICLLLALLLTILGSNTVLAANTAAPAGPQSPTTTPETVVNTGGVSDYFRVGSVAYWHSAGSCYTPTGSAPGSDQPGVNSVNLSDVLETANRVSLIGAAQQRTLYSKDLRATNSCAQYVFSRIVADNDFLYWVDATGLVKLSKNANLGDAPQLVSANFNDKRAYEITIGGNYIYLSRAGAACGPGLCFPIYPLMNKVDKTTGAISGIDCLLGSGCPYGHNMKVDPGGRYLYYLNSSNTLYRKDLSGATAAISIATKVTAYFPEGRIPCVSGCSYTDKVFFAQQNVSQVPYISYRDFELSNNSAVTIYTSNSPRQASINDLVSDKSAIFFFEVRQDVYTGGLLYTYTGWLFRAGRAIPSNPANIYQTVPSSFSAIDDRISLDTDNVKLYWLQGQNIMRLSDQATALPKSAMHVTGIEVTQGVQTLSNSVPLIMGKRTFVRVYVKSDDPSRDVPGVTARLQAYWLGAPGWSDWIMPASVPSLTVKRSPQRIHLNDGFLFELPWDWVNSMTLQVRVELNPNHNPEETDGYANDILTAGPFIMNVSPRLEIRLFDYSYSMGGKVFSPDPSEDTGNIDWITNAYPVSTSDYGFYGSGNGLRWESFPVRDDALAELIRYPTVPCEDKDTVKYPNDSLPDCDNMRAANYVSSQISGMRGGLENAYHDKDSTSYYGIIPVGEEMRGMPAQKQTYFPRGLDSNKDASGPAGAKYLGWYAGHEVGHSLGLGHPGTAGDTNECGIKGGDSLPTYTDAKIGLPNDATSVMGFRDNSTGGSPPYDDTNLYLPSATYDMMAYCLPQWISDQNYTRIFNNLAGYAPLSVQSIQSPNLNGNWLAIYGGIYYYSAKLASKAVNLASLDLR